MVADFGPTQDTDFFLMEEMLTEEEKYIRGKVRAFCEREIVPIINDYWNREEFPFDTVPKLAELNLAGTTIEGYGCPGLTPMASSLSKFEMARADGSFDTFFGAHSGLAMQSIYMLGSEEQKRKWLPSMARLEKIGAFALTEPKHGSDTVSLETQAQREGDEYILDGQKRWIGNASFADVIIVWARDDDGHVGGYLVEKDTPGVEIQVIQGKTSKRVVWQADIRLQRVRIPTDNRLAQAKTFKDTSRVLSATRYGVGWSALGHAVASYEAALAYAKERVQFGRPIASSQLVQYKLAKMLAEITAMQLICFRLTRLFEAGKMASAMASTAKMYNAEKARWVCAEARDILGGNGLLLENHVARHHADMEAVYTYEGTDTVQALIIGREITGVPAFA